MSSSSPAITIYSSTGTELATATNPLRTDPTGTTNQPVSGTVTSNQGTAAAISAAWPIKITDGTNLVTIKDASTAALATDTALVVAISPNNPLSLGGSSTPAESFANPTTAMLSQSFGMMYNGATWDRVKGSVANGITVDVTRVQSSVVMAGDNTSFAPYYDANPEGTSNLTVDPAGGLAIRGPVLTDEGGYSTSFSGSTLYITIGTCTFTNGSDQVAGVFDGYDLHLGDYVKLSTDADTAYAQVDSFTSTVITLVSNYTGTGGTGVGYSTMEKPVIGAGTSVAITNGQAVITAGTTAGEIVELERDCDILPAVFEKELLINQRIANQDIYIGVYDESAGGPKYYSWFRFNGTDSRLVICETGHNRSTTPGATDIQTTNYYFNQDTNTGILNRYRIEVKISEVNFIINDRIVARHKKVIMKASDFLTFTTRIVNGTTPASSTIIYQNYSRVNNFNEMCVTLNTKDSTLFKENQLLGDESGIPMKAVPHPEFRTTFANIYANNVDPAYWTLLQTGSGQTINQTGGNLVITTGTTTNSETIIRSNRTFTGQFMFRSKVISSARSLNQQFIFELVDVIGDGLALTINSATSITVTIPNNPFTSINIGQFVKISRFTGTAAQIPGRYAIASVSGNNVNFTVAGFPASGSGTCSLYGWNYHHIIYDTATVTSAKYDAQRMGWASGDTTLAVNTTVTGHYILLQKNNGDVLISDGLVASAATYGMTARGSRVENIPFNDCKLYLQVRCVNGTVAPTALTWTVGFISIEEYAAMPTEMLIGARGNMNTVNVGTMPTTTVTGTIVASGPGAANAAVSGNPVRIGASDGTNTRNVLSDATGRLIISSTDTTATGALGALNAANTIALNGTYSAGFQLAAGTLVGTLLPEWSLDGGTTWVAGLFEEPTTGARAGSLVYGSSNTAAYKSIILPGGASNVRVRVSVYTSGTANGTIRSSSVQLPRNNTVSTTGTVTSVAYSASNVTLLAANANRLGFTISNMSSTTLYVKFGATATTTTSFSVIIPTNGTYTYPNTTIYTGIIDGIWATTGSNSAVITEMT